MLLDLLLGLLYSEGVIIIFSMSSDGASAPWLCPKGSGTGVGEHHCCILYVTEAILSDRSLQ